MAAGGGALTPSVWFVGAPVSFAPEDAALVPPEADVRAVPPDDRHVTLVFLGRVSDDTAQRCWRSLPALALPGEVRALGWARFGASALALELADGDGVLEAAARTCHDHAAGVVEEEPPARFRPHVTMARVPRRVRPPSARALQAWPLPSRSLRIGPPTLFRTRAGPAAGRYEAVVQQE